MSAAEDRAGYIAGLRAYADALEQHDEIPLPYHGISRSPIFTGFYGEDAREELAAAVRALPCSFTKSVSGDGKWLNLDGCLGGGLHIQLYAGRDAVCTRRVVGTKEQEVEEEVTPAVTRKVVKPVEIVEWDCGPVLSRALDKASEPMRDQS